MDRRRLLLGFSWLLAAAPLAAAAEEAPHKQVGQYVDLLPVAMPIVADGQLVNYVFVNVRLILASGADPSRWRAKEPYFRDALVRAGHETPFIVPGDYQKIDAAKLSAALMRAARTIAGPGVVRAVVVTNQVPNRQVRPPHA